MTSYFILKSDEVGPYGSKLLSYSGVIKGGKVILTLKVEVGPDHHHTLESLEAIQTAHNRKPAPVKPEAKCVVVPRRIGKTAALLALPAPGKAGL